MYLFYLIAGFSPYGEFYIPHNIFSEIDHDPPVRCIQQFSFQASDFTDGKSFRSLQKSLQSSFRYSLVARTAIYSFPGRLIETFPLT